MFLHSVVSGTHLPTKHSLESHCGNSQFPFNSIVKAGLLGFFKKKADKGEGRGLLLSHNPLYLAS